MHYFLGVLALLGVGFIGLLIEKNKQLENDLKSRSNLLEYETNWRVKLLDENKYLEGDVKFLQANQKPIPWNKGKKGYKLNRKPKPKLTPEQVKFIADTREIKPEDVQIIFTPRID